MDQMELFPNLACMKDIYTQIEIGPKERGAIFTRREIVDFILDLSGYMIDQPLHAYRILEPSFGDGDFLLPIIERLLTAYEAADIDHATIVGDLADSIRAFEVHADSVANSRAKIYRLLKKHDLDDLVAFELIDLWLKEEDFLTADLPFSFSHAVGNPPYVRQELIPDVLMAEYRARYSTIYDRADLYIPFFERCLRSLEPGGVVGFICADRWMKNKYGGPLREMIASDFHLVSYIDMDNTKAFHSDVISYPAITIIKREADGATRVAHQPDIDAESLARLSLAIRDESTPGAGDVTEIQSIMNGSDPWLLQSLDQLSILRRLEREFTLFEDSACKVRIGVATGADRIFIRPLESLDIEKDRKLPLVTTRDIESGSVKWGGLAVINPFQDDGQLVDLESYPKLAIYLAAHENLIRARNVAKRNAKHWFRTIDRIFPALAKEPKLLIPDIKGKANVVYEDGRLYPHHNLYYVTSDEWDLRALQAILLSNVARLFVNSYSTKMRGGYLRFQAQYLRRIRLPLWGDVPDRMRKELIRAANKRDFDACNHLAYDLYQITEEEQERLEAQEAIVK